MAILLISLISHTSLSIVNKNMRNCSFMGLQALVCVAPTSPCKCLQPVLNIQHVYATEPLITTAVPRRSWYKLHSLVVFEKELHMIDT